MPKKVKVIILRTAGTNCDQETAFSFKSFGAQAELVHIKQLIDKKVALDDYHILAIPGGFTYGDDIESGRILANEINLKLGEALCRFLGKKKLIIGICNGFQVLVKSGLLPGPLSLEDHKKHDFEQTASLISNDSGKFEDRWTYLKVDGTSVWTKGLGPVVYFPVAHAEGKFVAKDKNMLTKLKKNKQVVFRYCTDDGNAPQYPENPNGSQDDIAGLTDRSGRVLGLMPHPERHFLFRQHPFWTRLDGNGKYGHGARIFKNGVDYTKRNL